MSAPDPDAVRAYLADRDMPCTRCGYNLRGLTQTVCPECGWAVSLSHESRKTLSSTDRQFLAGTVFSGIVIAIWIIGILGMTFLGKHGDALNILALVIPAVMSIVLGVIVAIWMDIRRIANRVKWVGDSCVLVSWLLGVAYLAFSIALITGALG